MAEEFPAAVCGGNWWNPPRAAFSRSSCSSVITDMGSFGGCWPSDLVDVKAKSSDESSDGSMVFQDFQKPGGGATTMSPDSAFPMMGVGLSNPSTPTTTDWINQSLLVAFSSGRDGGSPAATAAGNQGFSMDQHHPLNFITSSSDYPSSLVQTFFDTNSPAPPPPPPPRPAPPPPQSLYDFQSNLNDFDFVPNLPSIRPRQQVLGGLHLANKTPFWNASTLNLDDNISSFFPSTKTQYQRNCPNLIIKSKNEEIRDSGSAAKKSSGEPAFKRPRFETPSPLPSFKVRKEKLGDRITALQQLVSPFGKTDTASVLHEAIEYIKLLHDQVNVLSTPYMKNGATMQQQQIHDKVKDAERGEQDLRSLGLCLVPVSSTFPVATESAPGFWTPSFGGTFR